MKIALIWPNYNIPWPPKGWGAIEKYIWEYKINFEKMGHDVELKYSNSLDLNEFDIVQSHSWNQSINLHKRKIPYIFSFDDTHVINYGKKTELYKNNLMAIKNSEFTIVHGEFLIEWFNEKNIIHLRHGANPDKFKFLNLSNKKHKLLCIGKTDQYDRKGFKIAIESARKLNFPITVVGPNEEFFENNNINYDKLSILGDKDDDELNKIYNEHTIFLHPSKLETGHPNLTLIESIYCGTPVVGTCNISILGMKKIKPNIEDLIKGIDNVINNYDEYQNLCLKLKRCEIYDWYSISSDLIDIYKKKIKNQYG